MSNHHSEDVQVPPPDRAPSPYTFPLPDETCARCHQTGALAVEGVLEWAQPPAGGWGADQNGYRAEASRCCGAGLEAVTALATDTGAALAGAMPKVGAREVLRGRCTGCGRTERVRRWPWMVCGHCHATSRGKRW
ncbi:hypothetical protein [Streptomonospora litoralis]|uniref:Uncharacterized protein n=1 Tax=Streptomonospora litoralis TaxID=2498135 RepID=A0A4P6Q7Y9_9ACTN|nr:hypothetical protein [Streptomonospora litoralis]QBI56825.1 hypothetical protein EKD16_25425 [Streptomonospora litoralis]